MENARWDSRDGTGGGFFASYRWPLAAILALIAISVMAFTPRLIDYLSEGHWGQAATKAFEFATDALNAHALFGMALTPLFFLQSLLGVMLMGEQPQGAVRLAQRWQGRLLALVAGVLALLGLYITLRLQRTRTA
jgi:hypothetical protein